MSATERLKYDREYYLRNKETLNARSREYSKANKERVNAQKREYYKLRSDDPLFMRRRREIAKRSYRRNSATIRAARKTSSKKRRAEVKATVNQILGGKCTCCGEREPMFLDLDHVYNDGRLERRSMRDGRIHRKIASGECANIDRYQLLCRNCNWGKYRNGGVCPHKTKGAATNE